MARYYFYHYEREERKDLKIFLAHFATFTVQIYGGKRLFVKNLFHRQPHAQENHSQSKYAHKIHGSLSRTQ